MFARGRPVRFGLRRLRDDVRLEILYADETPHGSPVGGGIERTLTRIAVDIHTLRQTLGMAGIVARTPQLLRDLFERRLSDLYVDPRALRPACLYPDPACVRPVALAVTREGRP